MKPLYILISGLFFTLLSFGQGLKFSGGEQPIDKRTSYNVFGKIPVEFSGSFAIRFDLSLYPEKEIGYIIRIKNEKSDKIYNMFYDGQGNNAVFKFNEEGKSCLIVAEFEKEELLNKRWIKTAISFDLKNDSIKLEINGKAFASVHRNLPDKYSPVIVFGKSDHIVDIPSFAIKDLTVGDVRKYVFTLRENEGNVVHDSRGKAMGYTENPEWLINSAYHWSFKTSFQSETVAGSNYNPRKKEIYYFNRDTIYIYNIRTGKVSIMPFEERCPVKMALGTNFIDVRDNKLYMYEVFHDNPARSEVTMAGLDLETYTWTAEGFDILPTQLHHHSSYFDLSANRYIIFGGFGNMHYNKNFYSFDLDAMKWGTLSGFEGDTIFPRYFSSMGYSKKTNSIYVFGGMGNESGEQIVGRKYFYDLHKVDLNTKQITKLWEIEWDKNNVVPVRDMIIPDDSCFYTLCYPEHFSKSFLQLYRFSLKDRSHEILGDSIPIYSDKITTNANIYYDEQMNNLYAVVQEFDDDIASSLKIYSLSFPPIAFEDLANYPKQKNIVLPLVLLFSCIAATMGFILYKRLKKKKAKSPEHIPALKKSGIERVNRPNSICLFGDFTVRDRNNKDITYMFSSKLRQILFLLLQYSAEGGISSQRLSSLLWPDKPENKVKNSRGVTISHLRRALGELDGIELIHDKGFFKIVSDSSCYCDFMRCLQIISANRIEENRAELMNILTRGKFLKSSGQALFDRFKMEVEQKLEPVLTIEIEKSFMDEDYQATIELADILFNIDPLSDEALLFQTKALQKLKMDEEARIKYQAYIAEYKKTMGNDYPYPYKKL